MQPTIPIGVYEKGRFHCRGGNNCGLGDDCPFSGFDNCGAGSPEESNVKFEPIEDEI